MTGVLIVPVFNQGEMFAKCYRAWRKGFRSAEFVVVDNGSGRDTAEIIDRIATGDSRVKLVRNERNLGFAPAVNQGLSEATGDWVGLVNSDTEIDPISAEKLLHWISIYPRSLLGPLTNYTGSRQVVDVYRNRRLFLNHFSRLQKSCCFDVERVTGFALFGTAEVFKTVGLFDERFVGGNFEDDDYVLRARLAGVPVKIMNDVYVEHSGHATFGGVNPEFEKRLEMNRNEFFRKWEGSDLTSPVAEYLHLHSRDDEFRRSIAHRFSGNAYIGLQRAMNCYAEGNFEETLEALEFTPPENDPFPALFAGLAHWRLGNNREAKQLLWDSLRIRRFDKEAHLALAKIERDLGQREKVRELFRVLRNY